MKEKVYVAEGCYDYEGFIILGVFSKMEDAEKCKMEAENRKRYDGVEIEDFDLQ